MNVWRVPIAKWAVWEEGADSDFRSSLAFIDPMLRRRLSPWARGVLHVARACSENIHALQFVFASRHGELDRTMESLLRIAKGEEISPITFSLSVLNSTPGIFSIARRDDSATTAISAGSETFGFGLLEAYARAKQNPENPVLYVYADAPVPTPMGQQPCDPDRPFALGLLVNSNAADSLKTAMSYQPDAPCTEPQAFACLRALEGEAASWSSGDRQWRWTMQ